MNATSDETWLDILPALPLVRGVPVAFAAPEEDDHAQAPWDTDRGIVTHAEPERVMVSLDGAHDAGSIEAGNGAGWRIDLADPLGFGYALDVLYQRGAEAKGRWWLTGFGSLNYRARLGRTTDADRLELALALREVTA